MNAEKLISKYSIPQSAQQEDELWSRITPEELKSSEYLDAWEAYLDDIEIELSQLGECEQTVTIYDELIAELTPRESQLRHSKAPSHLGDDDIKRMYVLRPTAARRINSRLSKWRTMQKALQDKLKQKPIEIAEALLDLQKSSNRANYWLIALTIACAIGALA